MICIINYGINNIFSLKNCLDKINIKSKIITKPEEVKNDNKIILPGVGSFNVAMNKLSNYDWIAFLKKFAQNKNNHLLGICLGMQLLSSKSYEEVETNGFNLIETEVKKLSDMNCKNKLPHVGWNSLNLKNKCKLFKDIPSGIDFYFVHSYAMMDNKFVTAEFNYGNNYVAAVQRENVYGVQFHPEKSADGGKIVLKNFNDL